MDKSINLERFLSAQQSAYEDALAELRRGKKRTHWMWFIFPQLRGLGQSPTSEFYGISGREEATAYLNHPVLGGRLIECTNTVNSHCDASANDIFGYPDNLKFRSSMTLFALVADADSPFLEALRLFFDGEPDGATIKLLQEAVGLKAER